MSAHRSEYVQRINRVVDYVEAHLLEPLPLEQLASVAHFSPFHFHRVFRAMIGETPQQFVQRLRLERAALELRRRPDQPVTEIALESGFASPATFARAFRSAFGVSATQWRAEKERKLGKALRKEGVVAQEAGAEDDAMKRTDDLAKVTVKTLPPLRVAYVRNTGPYACDQALFAGLVTTIGTWAAARDVFGPDTTLDKARGAGGLLCVYHDSPDVTAEERLRISACVAIDDEMVVDGVASDMRLHAGRYAVAHFRIEMAQYPEAWPWLIERWLPDSGYQPDDHPGYERYLNVPEQDPRGKLEFEICLPVRPL
ncbi:MAG: GyrI-like domain-containing protein [Nannocystaceae bacterium]|nr:GyrI-like domain-containing protein [bacterium]